ncbi:tyrosine-type recombinase/integrase (plasmid) [Candidatus Megaera polyxenophila]|uniref:tyrosine-type recombinase/integrase n=1 Tax=Candidatus Megaera polyxenophila TaxID=988779 RepID=UPI00249F1055|nr:tyrosine-type recombinase/integrase [Candidatus Megaera polyxenophila]WHA07552.1 tyrosine-type recombinase/integrase [Candidatus Megaera polyxenophila]
MLDKLLNNFKDKMIAEDISDNTIKNYLSDIKNFYKWYREIDFSENIEKVTHYHLNAYKDYLIHNQRKKASSINRNIQSLRNFFQFMTGQKRIKKNPSEKIKFLRQIKRTQPKALTKHEIHKLLSVTSHSSHGTKQRNYALTQLLLQTGIRVGEIVNLEMRDLTLYDRSGEIRIVNAKGGKERTIPLNSSARKALRNYFEGKKLEERKVVFLSKQNKKMTVRAVQKVINSLAGKAGIENMSPHTLRHTFAINYLRSNPECLVELSALLGHESLDTTSIYTAASKERLANTVENAGQYINE